MKGLELDNDFFAYVEANRGADVNRLRLIAHGRSFPFPVDWALTQIEARSKTSRKLSSFLSNPRFLFPSLLAAEQSTHQAVALYHAALVGRGNKVADLTAGLGIDALAIAGNNNEVTAFEIDSNRADTLVWNSRELGVSLNVVEADSMQWLSNNMSHDCNAGCQDASAARMFDVIFIDPARRDADSGRTYMLSDCLPDVKANFNLISSHADKVIIKASPILDVSSVFRDIPDVSELHLVCVRGECKEVLIISGQIEKSTDNQPILKVVDLKDAPRLEYISSFECRLDELSGKAPIAEIADVVPGCCIYDPNAALHKLNCAALICERFSGLKRLAQNTDLYVSQTIHPDFPGRIFEIDSLPGKKDLKGLKRERWEVISRNYPQTADQLRAKYGLKSGGDRFLLAVRMSEESVPALLLAKAYRAGNMQTKN